MKEQETSTLRNLIEDYRRTGDEDILLELFGLYNVSVKNNTFDTFEQPSQEHDDDATMAFHEVLTSDSSSNLETTATFEDHSLEDSIEESIVSFVDSPYRQTGLLGKGGMGRVLQVQDQTLKRSAAMKLHHDNQPSVENLNAFLAEAQISALLQHPAIIPVYEYGTLDDIPYFTMQEIRGDTFKQVLRRNKEKEREGHQEQFTIRKNISVLHTVCEAIAFAHSKGVVHRDIKPSNILVGEFGEVYVVDWGIATILPTSAILHHGLHKSLYLNPQSKSIVGTVGYMSPEQAVGLNDQLDERTDIFALGSILFEILTGHTPFWAGDTQPLLWKQQILNDSTVQTRFIKEVRQALSKHNTGLEDVCLAAIQPCSKNRLDDVRQLVDHLQQWMDGASKRQQARIHIQNSTLLNTEIEQIQSQQHLALSKFELDTTTKQTLYEEWNALQDYQRTLEHKHRTLEQELQQAILYAPDILESHEALIELDFEKYKRRLLQRAPLAVEDIKSKMLMHLQFIDDKRRTEWLRKMTACKKLYTQHPFPAVDFGRPNSIQQLQSGIAAYPILNVHGPTGIGKSQLVLEALIDSTITNNVPFYYIRCKEHRDILDIYQSIATALGIAQEQITIEVIRAHFERLGPAHFIFDGVEYIHTILQTLLTELHPLNSSICSILISRSPQGLPPEQTIEIPRLPLAGALELFVTLAKQNRPSFVLTKTTFLALCDMLELLEYTPHTIELIASKVSHYTVLELKHLLTTSSHYTLASRDEQSLLDATIAWSWEQLSPRSQTTLAVGSMFKGSFTIGALGSILKHVNSFDVQDAPEVLEDLVATNLLRRSIHNSTVRYTLPYSLHRYASTQLEVLCEDSNNTLIDLYTTLAQYFTTLKSSLFDLKPDVETVFAILTHGVIQHKTACITLCGQILERFGPWHRGIQIMGYLREYNEDDENILNIALWEGKLLRLTGAIGAALDLIQHTISRTPTIQRRIHVDLHLELATLHQHRRDYDLSNQHTQKVIDHCSIEHHPLRWMHAYLLWGNTLNQQRQYSDALDKLLSIEPFIADKITAEARWIPIELYNVLCALYLEQGKYNKAMNAIEKGLWHAKQGDFPKSQSELYFQLSKIKILQGFHREGLPIAQKALQITQSTGDIYNEARILLTVGVCHNKMQEYTTAKSVYERALDCYRSIGNTRGEALVTINLAQIYPKLGLHSEMSRLFDKAMNLGTKMQDNRILGLVHSNKANYFASIGDFEPALKAYDQSKSFHATIQHEKGRTIATSNQAFILWQMQRFDEAEAMFQQSIVDSKELGIINNQVLLHGNYGSMLLELNRLEDGLQELENCIHLAQRSQYLMAEVIFSSVLARLYSKTDKHEAALALFERHKNNPLKDHEQYVLYECNKALCHFDANQLAKAIEIFDGMDIDELDLTQPTMWRVRDVLQSTKKSLGL